MVFWSFEHLDLIRVSSLIFDDSRPVSPTESIEILLGPAVVSESFGEVFEVGGGGEVGGELVWGESAVHVGAEGDEVAFAGDLFHVADVVEDVGDGCSAVFGGVDEEGGEEVAADDATAVGEGFDLLVGEVAFGVLGVWEEGAAI